MILQLLELFEASRSGSGRGSSGRRRRRLVLRVHGGGGEVHGGQERGRHRQAPRVHAGQSGGGRGRGGSSAAEQSFRHHGRTQRVMLCHLQAIHLFFGRAEQMREADYV